MTIDENKELVAKYPFLAYRGNPLFTGYDSAAQPVYEYTWADDLPEGWRKAFGNIIWDELLTILTKYNCVDKFEFCQIKEKYGSLRLYYDINELDDEVYAKLDRELTNWSDKYETLSMMYCIDCSKPTKYLSKGYITYLCKDCAKGKNVERLTAKHVPKYSKFINNVFTEITTPELEACEKLWSEED